MTDRKPRLKLSFETVGSIAAMIIGACALFIAWDQAQVMRAQQHASVWPLLAADFTLDAVEDGLLMELTLSNEGVGPALIESAYLTINGEQVTDQSSLLDRVFGNLKPVGSARISGADIEKGTIGAGDEVRAFRVVWDSTEQNLAAFQALAGRYVDGDGPDVSVTACYCSVFDRCFVTNGRDRPKPVKSCPAATGFLSTMLKAGTS